MTTYTAADFARAEFARNRDGRLGARLAGGTHGHEWIIEGFMGAQVSRGDADMASELWAPVRAAHSAATDEDHGVTTSEEDAEFWQARWKEAADRADARDAAARLWKETTRRAVHGGSRWRTLAESGVRITAEVAAHRDQMRTRAEKAEGHLRDRTVDLVEAVAERDKARRERDHVAEESKARAESIMEQQKMIDRLRAGQPRPLAPDDITDRFVDHVHEDYFWSMEERVRLDKLALRNALRDAVKRSQEPTRPEGAEEIERLLAEAWETSIGKHHSDAETYERELADFLAERGVRVTGAES